MMKKNMKNIVITKNCIENNSNIKDQQKCINDYRKTPKFINFEQLALKKVKCMNVECNNERKKLVEMLSKIFKQKIE
jgi:hypothetical protein